jgi:hypothetical protein
MGAEPRSVAQKAVSFQSCPVESAPMVCVSDALPLA